MKIQMPNVREYAEHMPVELRLSDDNRLIIVATNQGGHDCTQVDLLDLLNWLRTSPNVELDPIQWINANDELPALEDGESRIIANDSMTGDWAEAIWEGKIYDNNGKRELEVRSLNYGSTWVASCWMLPGDSLGITSLTS